MEDWPKALEESFLNLHREIFGEEYSGGELADKKTILIQLAYTDPDQVVGFKIGYEISPEEFYSWKGAVAVSARNYGIASSLLFAQHDWAKANGYKRISTKTRNEWRNMLILNIRNGFDVVGTEPDGKRGGVKILLSKTL